MRKQILSILSLTWMVIAGAQEHAVRIVEESLPNRLALYALNESETDYDVMLTVKGTNFRQSKARPRFIRVPATSKVHMKTLVLFRGKQPSYTYELVVNDSLSGRALRKESEEIKISPKKQITLYITPGCQHCDSLLTGLHAGPYRFNSYHLVEMPEIRDQLQKSLGNMPVDSLTYPIVNLGGRLHLKISSYEELLEALDKE